MVGIVADPEARLNSVGETRRGPAVRIESGGSRPTVVQLRHHVLLFLIQTAGATGGPALPQTFDAFAG